MTARRFATGFLGQSTSVLVPALCLSTAVLTGCGTPFRAQDQLTLTAARPAQRLLVHNSVGDVVVSTDPAASEVRAVITRVGKGANQAEADKALEQIEISLAAGDDDGGVLRAEAQHPRGNSWRNYEVAWRITTPPDVAVTVGGDIGDVAVSGVENDVTIKTAIGDVTVTCPDDAGPVQVVSGVGDIRVQNARGGLKAASEVGDIHVSAAGAVDARSDVGDVHLRMLPGKSEAIRAASDVGDVVVHIPSNQKGLLEADTDVGDVNVRLEGVTLKNFRHRHHRVSAALNGASDPLIDLSSDVGDVVVRAYSASDSPPSPDER